MHVVYCELFELFKRKALYKYLLLLFIQDGRTIHLTPFHPMEKR